MNKVVIIIKNVNYLLIRGGLVNSNNIINNIDAIN